jgi:hypothetical protein
LSNLFRETRTLLFECVVLSSLESPEFLFVKTVLLVLPQLFASSETLCTLRLVPPLLLSELCFLDGPLIDLVEGERTGRGEAHVKVLVADLVYPRVGVV